jgi:hypothetical protein
MKLAKVRHNYLSQMITDAKALTRRIRKGLDGHAVRFSSSWRLSSDHVQWHEPRNSLLSPSWNPFQISWPTGKFLVVESEFLDRGVHFIVNSHSLCYKELSRSN